MRSVTTALVLAALSGAMGIDAGATPGSDRVGAYAVIERVVFEPSANNPARIQIWGAFALANRQDTSLYGPVERGYLYFRAESPKELATKEWNDLKALAGTKRIVAFGTRFGTSTRLRSEGEKPEAPDVYVAGLGVQTIRPDTDYAPIKALAAYIKR
jgi:hypothetical protein